MNDFEILTNNQQKQIKSLKNKKDRDELGLFLVEGIKLCNELMMNKHLFIDKLIIPGNASDEVLELADEFSSLEIDVFKVERRIFDSLFDMKSPQEALAIAKFMEAKVDYTKPFIALEGISDPGNMGTILRSADWFGFEQIITDEDTADIYNPKVVRASMGSIFRVNVIRVANLKQYIEENFPEHNLIGTYIESGKSLKDIEITNKIGILFGNESKGISKTMERIINTKIHIDGFGSAESLNVAVASGIILYEISNKLNFNNAKL